MARARGGAAPAAPARYAPISSTGMRSMPVILIHNGEPHGGVPATGMITDWWLFRSQRPPLRGIRLTHQLPALYLRAARENPDHGAGGTMSTEFQITGQNSKAPFTLK